MVKKYLLAAFGYLILGLLFGIYMASSQNHGQLVTHAHILLVGFLLSFCYSLCHQLWLSNADFKYKTLQFYLHQIGAVGLVSGLFLMFAGLAPGSTLGPILGLSAFSVLIAAILMKIAIIKSLKAG